MILFIVALKGENKMKKFLSSIYSMKKKSIMLIVYFILCFFAVLVVISFGNYLELRWSPRGRALFKSVGKKVINITQDFPSINNEGKLINGPPKILLGNLENISIKYEFLGVVLRFKMNNEKQDTINNNPFLMLGSVDGALEASEANLLQPVEQSIDGKSNISDAYFGLLIVWLILYLSYKLKNYFEKFPV